MINHSDTIVAAATPPGTGGVGIVRVSGDKTEQIARKLLGSLPEPRAATFRAFRDAAWQQRLANNDYYRFAEEADEHLAVVDGLISGNAKQASRAMARHIRAGVKYWSRGLPT